MKTIIFVAIVTLGIWIALMISLRCFAGLLRRQTVKAARNAIHPEKILKIVENSGYLGARFPGPNLPPRTSGVLVLSESRLFFLPLFPRKAITIPRRSIRSVKTSFSFDGKTHRIPALVVVVKDVGDPDGEMAWLVHDPEEWERVIKEIL
jgi:hypothetical protein